MRYKIVILSIIILVVAALGFVYYQNYEGDFYEVCFVYFSDDKTYVVVGDTKIKVSDEPVKLYAKHIINDPFNQKIQSPTSYKTPNAYMFEELVSLYDDMGNIYIVDVKNKKTKVLQDVVTYQIAENKKEVMVLYTDKTLRKLSGTGFEQEKVLATGIESFVTDDKFKQIYTVNENSNLIQLNQNGDSIGVINESLKTPTLLRIDGYLIFNDDDHGHVYSMEYNKSLGEFDSFIFFENCQYIDNTLLIRTRSSLYRVSGKSIEKIRGDYMMSENVSTYYQATNRTINQMRGDVQALLLDDNENIYTYLPKKGRTEVEIAASEKYIGTLTDDLTYVFKEVDLDRVTLYNQKNDWRGERIELNSEPLWVKGHNAESFIFITDEKALLQMYDGEQVIALNILSEHFKNVFYGPKSDYYIVDLYGLTHVSRKGEERRIFEDEHITSTLYDPSAEVLYFLDNEDSLFSVKGEKVLQIAEEVSRIDLFRNSMYYLTKSDTLIYYYKENKIVISTDVQDVHAVTTNIRLLGSYNTVHTFYILENN